jgi:hypothetical protein
MRGLLLLLAACGGGGGDDGGSFEATANGEAFSADCKLTESEAYMDIYASNGSGTAFELKWNKALINTTGTFMTGGIVSDLSLFVLLDDEISSATGKVTFTTYTAPREIAGTFELVVPTKPFMATGMFDCH